MYKRILIPTDGSKLADSAVHHGVALAKALGADVTALTVTAPFQVLSVMPHMVEATREEYKIQMQQYAAATLAAVAGEAKTSGVAYETLHVEDEHPYQAIIETARLKGCDLIVMASHGRRGVSAILLGSETVKVLTHSKIPVLVHR